MLPAENIFALATIIFLLALAIWKKKVPWKKLGFLPKPWWAGWVSIVISAVAVVVFAQLVIQFTELPDWLRDKDPFLNLLLGVILQELIFRSVLVTWLEKWGRQKALWISSILFAAIHLLLPDPWFITAFSLIGGYFLGWHFSKHRNIYWLVVLHLLANLSFNYLLF